MFILSLIRFMAGEEYDVNYHSIKAQAIADGRIGKTGCPNKDGTPEVILALTNNPTTSYNPKS